MFFFLKLPIEETRILFGLFNEGRDVSNRTLLEHDYQCHTIGQVVFHWEQLHGEQCSLPPVCLKCLQIQMLWEQIKRVPIIEQRCPLAFLFHSSLESELPIHQGDAPTPS